MVGIGARNKNTLDMKFICPVCSLILRDPIQLTQYGHRYCRTCLNAGQETTIKCRRCQADTAQSEIIHDKMENHYLTEQHQQASQLNDRQIDFDSSLFTDARACNTDTAQLKEVNERLNMWVGGIEILTNDEQHLAHDLLQMPITLSTLTEESSNVKSSIEELNAFLGGVKHNQDLSLVQENIDDLQHVSYDGTFVWKITNFQEKMIDTLAERQTSIYSPPFYSSPNGYKMRARLYLNSDRNVYRSYVSLFFVLMRGEYDAILKFPFNYKVTFCLYDQTPAQQHMIDSFRSDIRSNSFQRPRSDTNIVGGILKFIPLEMIQQEGNPYVRDDTMFIKIMVDFQEIPNTLLSYALSLNPGLPTYVQQAMIKQEVKRRLRQQCQDSNEIKGIQLSCEETIQ
ncbi:unnamed protein product [Rotaria sordida]|uniref:MATH domain-containing protein n=2 Tax=Rotaria sordida TaxID=392033 RepID=A0A814NTK6_9BILA|nr:unnamed protein product [Rotaria sordida]